ncbi:hypothetical protein Asphe3_06520 [Pseudarthrobacter phenanthrenivorans Sphe3]|jgi:hypothetical protein|uniref:Uncharacterized protein n=1 Tax=Pseudarthrobacter phenanthrenivorans (strain DSM 18606 / JCM 16027 / LMG 23796 / Sphe3) TaxID=930171 RepID=F0MBH9_PSEPM|nr:hypothetical protein [Pseudarthrobacter phenanthrenivorans]ADX71861.1 hypothetical protein Asphe3_06520 [Pseudarthrobacter phenanthrenivorans Sphe3]
MTASTTLLPAELDAEVAELLPMRETLCMNINVSPVIAVNLSMAINAGSIGSIANSAALQDILVLQE